jgi:hypothetical protein
MSSVASTARPFRASANQEQYMSASDYKPNTGMSPAQIAKPSVPGLMPGQPLPTVPVERFPSGQIGSANTCGGYVDPAKFNKS